MNTHNCPGNASGNQKKLPRRLAAFDFDETISARDTDTEVIKLLPPEKITQETKDVFAKGGWVPYMIIIFRLLHESGFTREQILKSINDIPENPGFTELFKTLRKQNCDLIIISDANIVFVDHWLRTRGIRDLFDTIITNPACFDSKGHLHFKPYHNQTECSLCPANLCKGKVLREFLTERREKRGIIYDQLLYVGDSENDICPILQLGKNDLAGARADFRLAKDLASQKELNVQPKVMVWKNGFELRKQIESSWQMEGANAGSAGSTGSTGNNQGGNNCEVIICCIKKN